MSEKSREDSTDPVNNPKNGVLEQTDVLPPASMIGGKYRLGRLIGEGGMGAVYEAEHTGLRIRVAVKLLNELFLTDPSAIQRFTREAQTAAAIRHPNVVEVTDTGADAEGMPFIVMELLDGESLSSLLRREKILPPPVAVNIALQMLSGLAAAHDKGVIHRDLKPGNILLARTNGNICQVKILDFGISKFFTEGSYLDVTATGAVIGTPRFMAPEQARGQGDLDGRVDLYAVGVLLFRMVTGRLPFAAKTPDEIIKAILAGKITSPRKIRPSISPDLERVILKAMAPKRENRYSCAREFYSDLFRIMPEADTVTTIPIATQTTHQTTPTPLNLYPGAEGNLSLRLSDANTKPAGPNALRARRMSTRIKWMLFTLLLVGVGVPSGLYFGMKNTPSMTSITGGIQYAGPPIRLGITRYLPKNQLVNEHRNLVQYLSHRLKRKVELIVHEDYIDLSAQLTSGSLDVAALSAYAYVKAKRLQPNLHLIATHQTESGTSYEGYIVSKAETGIRSLEDLKGKVFCYVSPTSTSGYLFPRAVFRQHKIDPDRGFKATRFTGDHLAALKALESGACDGAAVFAGIFFEAKKHGMPPEKFTILAATARIPYDAYCVPPTFSSDMTQKISKALLALVPGSDLAKKILGEKSRIIGFVEARDSDYDPVRQIEQYLDEPYEATKRKIQAP